MRFIPRLTQIFETQIGSVEDLTNDIVDVIANRKINATVERIHSTLAAFSSFVEKPSLYTLATGTFLVLKQLGDHRQGYFDYYFDGDEWARAFSSNFDEIIVQAIVKKNRPTTIGGGEEGSQSRTSLIYEVTLGDVKIAWMHNSVLKRNELVMVNSNKIDQAREIIKQHMWDFFGNKPIVMSKNRHPGRSDDSDTISFATDDDFLALSSEKASQLATYLKRCLDAGVARSLLLHGPPGTGKSTMAREIINLLHLKSFRIRVEDLLDVDSKSLVDAINLFTPDAVILDDFDRSDNQVALLEALEFFQKHVKLVIATANNPSKLDSAVLRPGRIDELIEVEKLDSEVIRRVLSDEYEDAYETVKEWPIAFVHEYVKRRRFMGAEDASKSLIDLTARLTQLREVDELDEMTDFMNRLEENKDDEEGKEDEELKRMHASSLYDSSMDESFWSPGKEAERRKHAKTLRVSRRRARLKF